MNSTQFIEQIVRENLWARDIYATHISLTNKLYPYSFMDEVSDAFVEIVNVFFTSEINSKENLAKIKTFLETIESGLQTNSEEIITLISVGFIENISPDMRTCLFLTRNMKSATLEIFEYHYLLSTNIPSVGSAAGWKRVTVTNPNESFD
jgi:hypothetical protein